MTSNAHAVSSLVRTAARRRAGSYSGLLVVAFLLLFSSSAIPHEGRKHGDANVAQGWVCNAYGLSRKWSTYQGRPKATKEAAQRDVMTDCRKDAATCQPSGCWPA
jgi:hypothetical protein